MGPAFVSLSPTAVRPRSAGRRRRTIPTCSLTPDPSSPSRRAFLSHVLNTLLVLPILPHAARADAQQSTVETPSTTTPPPAPAAPSARKKPLWSYEPPSDPPNWHSLSPDYTIAATGQRQSPIELSYRTALVQPSAKRPQITATSASATIRLRTLPNAAVPLLLVFPYIPPPPPIVGDAPPVDIYAPPPPLAVLKANDQTYLFRTMHFHIASEHIVDGKEAPFEMHLVFEKRQGVPLPVAVPPPPPPPPSPAAATVSSMPPPGVPRAQAAESKPDAQTESSLTPTIAPSTVVVAILGQSAAESAPWLSSVLETVNTTSEENRSRGVVHQLNMQEVLPSFNSTALYQYMGSLTTPPCTEGIQWIVLGDRMDVSERDCQTIAAWQRGKNVRPIQETNGRQVIRYPPVTTDGPN